MQEKSPSFVFAIGTSPTKGTRPSAQNTLATVWTKQRTISLTPDILTSNLIRYSIEYLAHIKQPISFSLGLAHTQALAQNVLQFFTQNRITI
jgi:hypothetical protein